MSRNTETRTYHETATLFGTRYRAGKPSAPQSADVLKRRNLYLRDECARMLKEGPDAFLSETYERACAALEGRAI